jgi:hypothetical protein
MARVTFKDSVVDVPNVVEGEVLLKELDVPSDRNLIVIRSSGSELVTRHNQVQLSDDDRFEDIPTFEYGK